MITVHKYQNISNYAHKLNYAKSIGHVRIKPFQLRFRISAKDIGIKVNLKCIKSECLSDVCVL